MSAPYLNRGESIVMTTHRVSVDAVFFDLMLTNDRIILIDSSYTRFEPRIIPFSSVISVKGGIAPTREPAIVLTLEETGELSNSYQLNLIFSQEPGEDRAYERGQWVRKLIELVVKARERAAQEDTLPPDRMTGVQPSIRRFIAPDALRPHKAADEPAPPQPQPVIVVDSVEPDSLEFFLEELRSKKTDLPDEQPPGPEAVTFDEVPREEPAQSPETAIVRRPRSPEIAPVMTTRTEETVTPPVPEPEEDAMPSRSPEISPAVSPPEASPVAIMDTEPQAAEVTPDTFATTVLAATRSLQSSAAGHQPPEVQPAIPDTDEQDEAAVTGAPSDDHPPATAPETKNIPVVTGEPHRTDPVLHEEPPLPPPAVPGQLRELPGTYTPSIPPAGTGPGPSEIEPAAQPPVNAQVPAGTPRAGRPATIAGILVVAALVVVAAGFLFLTHTLPWNTGDDQYGIATPVTTVAPATVLPTAEIPPAGIQVNIYYPGTFAGTIGDTEYPRRVTGTGNQSYTVVINRGIVQALVQKQDNSGEALTVEIYNNNTMISRKTVTAPMGEIHLLIDLATSRPPGIAPDTPYSPGQDGTGNATLVYY